MRILYLTILLSCFLFGHSGVGFSKETKLSEYEKTKESLPLSQKEILNNLDAQVVNTFDPLNAITLKNLDYQACVEEHPEFIESKPNLLSHHYQKKKDHFSRKKDLYKNVRAIEFMDKQILLDHINLSINLQSALIKGLGEIAVQEHKKQGKMETFCTEQAHELKEGYPADTINHLDFDPKFNYREVKELGLHNCGLQFVYLTPQENYISTAFIFSTPDDDIIFDTSATVRNEEKERLAVENFWIDFGHIDTRKDADYASPYPELLIANMPREKIIAALEDMMDRPAIIAVQAKGWDQEVAFTNNKIELKELQKMGACVVKIDPALKEAMKTSKLFQPVE